MEESITNGPRTPGIENEAGFEPRVLGYSLPVQQLSLRDLIALLPNAFLVASLAVYGAGLIIENLHLQQYGLFHADFLRVEYLMVGLLWAALVAFCSVLTVTLRDNLINAKGKFAEGKRMKAVAEGSFTLLTIFCLFCTGLHVVMKHGSPIEKEFWIALGVLLSNVGAATNLLDFAKSCSQFSSARLEPMLKYISSNKLELSKRMLLCLTGLSAYGIWVFPNLNPALGGGDKQQVELFIKREKIEIVRKIPCEVSNDGRLGPLPLLVQETDAFVVLQRFKSDEHAVRISKDLVDATVYQQSR